MVEQHERCDSGSQEPVNMRVDYNLNHRHKWMLRLLYTPNESGVSEPIHGRTRIQKAMFLLQRKLREEFRTRIGFKFEPYKYGPFDERVYEVLEELEMKQLVTTTPAEEHDSPHDSTRYELTEDGAEEAEKLWGHIDDEKKRLCEWVRYEQADRPLGSLLSYVYRMYPEMTTNSEIADRVEH